MATRREFDFGGLLAAAQRVEQTYISPGQRLDLLLDLRKAKEGRPVTLATLAFDPMHAEGAGADSMAGRTTPRWRCPRRPA